MGPSGKSSSGCAMERPLKKSILPVAISLVPLESLALRNPALKKTRSICPVPSLRRA